MVSEHHDIFSRVLLQTKILSALSKTSDLPILMECIHFPSYFYDGVFIAKFFYVMNLSLPGDLLPSKIPCANRLLTHSVNV